MKTEINIIAHIHSDFSSKFGIPRQSGLVDELEATIIFYLNTETPMRSEELKNTHICGFFGSFRNVWARNGLRPYALRGSAETKEWAFLQPAPHSDLTL